MTVYTGMSERETLPPGSADEAALAFGRRMAEIATRPRRDLGLLRELAEAYVEIGPVKETPK